MQDEMDIDEAKRGAEGALWRGEDFSGMTLVLGVGTGRLLEILVPQAAVSHGHILAIESSPSRLEAALPLRASGPLTVLQARPGHLPVRTAVVDLLVVNGVLRQIPEGRLNAFFQEVWRTLVPGGRLRVSDIIETHGDKRTATWEERNRIVRKLGQTLDEPVAIAVDLPRVAKLLQQMGFENLEVALLPGYALTDAWLEDTVNAIRNMTSRVTDPVTRSEIIQRDIPSLVAAYGQGDQIAAERFVLRGTKAGDLALDMTASFTEDDLLDQED